MDIMGKEDLVMPMINHVKEQPYEQPYEPEEQPEGHTLNVSIQLDNQDPPVEDDETLRDCRERHRLEMEDLKLEKQLVEDELEQEMSIGQQFQHQLIELEHVNKSLKSEHLNYVESVEALESQVDTLESEKKDLITSAAQTQSRLRQMNLELEAEHAENVAAFALQLRELEKENATLKALSAKWSDQEQAESAQAAAKANKRLMLLQHREQERLELEQQISSLTLALVSTKKELRKERLERQMLEERQRKEAEKKQQVADRLSRRRDRKQQRQQLHVSTPRQVLVHPICTTQEVLGKQNQKQGMRTLNATWPRMKSQSPKVVQEKEDVTEETVVEMCNTRDQESLEVIQSTEETVEMDNSLDQESLEVSQSTEETVVEMGNTRDQESLEVSQSTEKTVVEMDNTRDQESLEIPALLPTIEEEVAKAELGHENEEQSAGMENLPVESSS